MKLNKKGSTRVLVAALGGGIGVFLSKKIVPANIDNNLKMAAPGLLGLLIVNVMPKSTMAEAAACGMAGQSGGALVDAKVINGVMAADTEEQILLDAMTDVRGTIETETEVQEALEAAASFDASVAAAASFDASVAGAGSYSNDENSF